MIPAFLPSELCSSTANHTNAIKLGMVVSMAASALLVPWTVAISGQLKGIDGVRGLADVQMVSCALLSLEFIIPMGIWMATSYRFEDRSADVTQAMNDLGWILFMTVVWSAVVQFIAVGAAILLDRRPGPVLPRWLGYLSLWVAVLILPAGTVLYFKDGPFAWNGLIGLYVPLSAFCVWVGAMTWCVHHALTRQISARVEPGARTSHLVVSST